jgi:hypothetical protein
MVKGSLPGQAAPPRNGLEQDHVPYVYRGTGRDTLTADLDSHGSRGPRAARCPACRWPLRSSWHAILCLSGIECAADDVARAGGRSRSGRGAS